MLKTKTLRKWTAKEKGEDSFRYTTLRSCDSCRKYNLSISLYYIYGYGDIMHQAYKVWNTGEEGIWTDRRGGWEKRIIY